MEPRKSKPKSGEGSDRPESDSVYDFLYHDAQRIGSFLGQFDPDGHLKGLQTSADTGRSRGSKTAGGGTGGVPLIATGTASHEQDEAQHWDRGAQRTYDPLWANARAFLDYIAQADLVERDAAKAAIGQFVLISGQVFVLDTAILKALTAGTLFRQFARGGTSAPAGPRQAKATGPNNTDFGIEILNAMPSTVQARVATHSGDAYWGSLAVEGLTSSPGDLMLKHGILLGGTWSMLGILDAVPTNELSDHQSEIQNAITMATLGPIIGGLGVMADALRPMLGRPSDAYGIIPLLVFREIGPRT